MTNATVGFFLPLYALIFLTFAYGLSALWASTVNGVPWSKLRPQFFRHIGYEAILLPMSVAMVAAYLYQGLALFVLFGANGLIFNIIFRRAVRNGDSLQRRVQELEALKSAALLRSLAP